MTDSTPAATAAPPPPFSAAGIDADIDTRMSLRIHRVHHLHSSHFAVELDRGRVCILLDSVPSEGPHMETTTTTTTTSDGGGTMNEKVSKQLYDELVKLQLHSMKPKGAHTAAHDKSSEKNVPVTSPRTPTSSSTSSMAHSRTVSSSQQKSRAAINNLKNNITKIFNKNAVSQAAAGSNDVHSSQLQTTPSPPLDMGMNISSLKSTINGGLYNIKSEHMLAIYDPMAPFVSCFFDERVETVGSSGSGNGGSAGGAIVNSRHRTTGSSNENEIIRFYAMQANGMLWSWRWDDSRYRWISCGFNHIHLTQQQHIGSAQWCESKHEGEVQIASQSMLSHSISSNCARFCMLNTRWIVWTQTLNLKQRITDTAMKIDISQRVGTFCREILVHSQRQAKGTHQEWLGLGPPIELVAERNEDTYSSNTPRTISASDVFDILAIEDGIWIFCKDQIHYVSMRDVEKFHSNVPLLANDSSSLDASSSSVSSGKSFAALFTTHAKNIQFFDTETPSYSIHYCAHTVHPSTGQLVLLGIDGRLRISPRPSSFDKSTSIFTMKTVQSLSTRTGIEDYINHYHSLLMSGKTKTRTKATDMGKARSLEICFIGDTLFAITNGETCMIFESNGFTLLQQTLLPSEIVMDNDECTTIFCRQSRFGSSLAYVQCGTGVFQIRTPSLQELLCESIEHGSTRPYFTQRQRQHQSQDQNQQNHHDKALIKTFTTLSKISHEHRMINAEAKYLLDLIRALPYEYTKSQSKSSSAQPETEYHITQERWRVMVRLCELLQNPALAWTSTDSLMEQRRLIDYAKHFVTHFPKPDSSFWKGEKRKDLSNIHSHLSQWDSILDASKNDDISPEERYKLLTPLNLSVFNTLAESITLARHQLDTLSFHSDNIKSPDDNPVLHDDQTCVSDLTLVELEDLAMEQPYTVLNALCRFCGLEDSVLKMVKERHVMDAKEIEQFVNDHYLNVHHCMLFDDDTEHIIVATDDASTPSQLVTTNMSLTKITADEMEGNALYFDILCRLLFTYNDSNNNDDGDTSENTLGRYSYLVCVLVLMIEKLRKWQLHLEKRWLDNKSQNKSSSLEELNRLQFQIHQKSVVDYRKQYALRVLECIDSGIFFVDMQCFNSVRDYEGNRPHFTRDQASTVACLLYWTGQRIEAIKLFLAEKMVSEAINVVRMQYGQHLALDDKIPGNVASDENLGNDNTGINLISLQKENVHQDQHEELFELIHVLTQFSFAKKGDALSVSVEEDNLQKLKDLLRTLIPVSYNVFDFFKTIDQQSSEEREKEKLPSDDKLIREEEEEYAARNVFATETNVMSLEKLLPILQQFARNSE